MLLKDKIASGLGSVLEWYDFSLYGFFAPLIAQIFFPNQNANIALLKTFSIFAVGFFARPVGALIFGSISDKYGRTVSLKITPILITVPTLLFSILPTYQQIGVVAPVLLILIRLIQGICIGGEYANNIVYLCESANSKYRYLMGSLGSCTGSLGILLASTVSAILYQFSSNEFLISYGWRIAFLISLPLGVLTYLLRINMQETHEFIQVKKDKLVIKSPVIDSLRYQWRDYLVSFGLTFLPATAFYYVFIFLPNFLSVSLKLDTGNVLGNNSISLLSRLFIIPIIGFFADKVGGIKISKLAALLFMLFSYPMLIGILNNFILYPLLFCFAILTTLNAATTPGLLIDILKANTRCTILSFTFNFCFGIFGGIVPMISLFLIEKTGNNISSIYYLIFAAFITFLATFFFKKGQYHA